MTIAPAWSERPTLDSYELMIKEVLDKPPEVLFSRRHWAGMIWTTNQYFKRLLQEPSLDDFKRNGLDYECLEDFATAFNCGSFISDLEGLVELTDALNEIVFIVDITAVQNGTDL